ncbi:MAG: GC-type dockerin domain-anchored protein, partial [Planctomycetota bacterium]
IVGVKLEFRREPPNFSIWGEFEFAFPESTTGGDWLPFSFTVTDDDILAVGDFPPDPTSVTVLPFRFFGDAFSPGTSPTGTVFIDDLCIVQGAGSPGCSPADLAEPFGVLNFFDISTFIAAFNAQDPAADLAAPFGSFNFFDVSTYITLYNQGCP